MRKVEFPQMRNEVISALEAVSDRTYQQRVWVDGIMPDCNYYDDLDLNIHILLEDINVCVDPVRWVGVVLLGNEVGPLRELGVPFLAMIGDLGDVSDADYLADPRWDEVIRLAQTALTTMKANEARRN